MPKLSFHALLVVLLGLTAPLSAQQYWVSTPSFDYSSSFLLGIAVHPTTGDLYFTSQNSLTGYGGGSVKRLSMTEGFQSFSGSEVIPMYGNSSFQVTDGTSKIATFSSYSIGINIDVAGNVYVGDSTAGIRKITPDGYVSSLGIGSWLGAISSDSNGNLYAFNGDLLKVDTKTNVNTVPGIFSEAWGIAVDRSNNVYVSGGWSRNWIQKIATNGEVTNLGRFSLVSGDWGIGNFACDQYDNLYGISLIEGKTCILKIDPQGNQSTIAGGFSMGKTVDGIDTNATFSNVSSIAVDDSGIIYVVDSGILRLIGLVNTWRTTQRGADLFVTGYNGPLSNAVTIPSQINGQQVTGIAAYAFAGNTNITSLTIPSGVTTIGTAAFSGCPQLTNVSLPDSVISLGANIFDGDYNLTSFQASVTLQSFLSQYASELGISPMAVSSFTSATQASLFNSIGTGLTNNTGFLGGLTGQILVAGGNYGLATKADLLPLAAKADLLTLASKSELEPLARKSDLTTLASKSELEPLAKKTDLTILATKAEMAALTADTNFVASLARNPNFLRALAEQITAVSTNYGIASKDSQTLSFAPVTVTYSKKTKTVSLAAKSSAKLTPIKYTIGDGSSPLGSISGNVLTLTGVKGTTTITASQAGTPYVNPATATVNLTVK